MKKRILILFAVFLTLAALLLFTAPGHRLLERMFPTANLDEFSVFRPGSSEKSPSAYTSSLTGEVPGRYRLQSVRSPELELSSEELDAIRRLGIPLQLELSEDGSAAVRIFDLNLNLSCDVDRMQFHYGPEIFPFFYQDGLLTLWEGETRLVFEKDPFG